MRSEICPGVIEKGDVLILARALRSYYLKLRKLINARGERVSTTTTTTTIIQLRHLASQITVEEKEMKL